MVGTAVTGLSPIVMVPAAIKARHQMGGVTLANITMAGRAGIIAAMSVITVITRSPGARFVLTFVGGRFGGLFRFAEIKLLTTLILSAP